MSREPQIVDFAEADFDPFAMDDGAWGVLDPYPIFAELRLLVVHAIDHRQIFWAGNGPRFSTADRFMVLG